MRKAVVMAGLCALLLSGLVLLPREGSAQATNLVCTGCVQESDLANGAVSAAKLKTGAVTNGKIAASAVNGAKISNGAVTAPKIGPSAVNATKIATGAVTAAKIGPGAVNVTKLAPSAVSTAKIQPGAVTASRLADRAVAPSKLGLAHTSFIGDSGDAVANCDELRALLAGLAGPAAVVLGPGTYACGANPVVLTAGVHLIGVDRGLVTITGELGGTAGVVQMEGADVLLRGVTVINDIASGTAVGVEVGSNGIDTPDWRIRDVAVEASTGSSNQAIAIFLGNVDCGGGEIRDAQVTANSTSTARGLEVQCSGPVTAVNLTAVADLGASGFGVVTFNPADLTVRNSALKATNITAYEINGSLRVYGSEIDGTVSGTVVCVGNYDEAGAALANGTFGSGGCI